GLAHSLIPQSRAEQATFFDAVHFRPGAQASSILNFSILAFGAKAPPFCRRRGTIRSHRSEGPGPAAQLLNALQAARRVLVQPPVPSARHLPNPNLRLVRIGYRRTFS